MKLFTLIAFTFFVTSFKAYSQDNFVIHGKIINKENEAVPDVKVFLTSNTKQIAVSNKNGEYFKADHISQMMNIPYGFIWNLPAFQIGKATAEHLLKISTDCEPLLIAN